MYQTKPFFLPPHTHRLSDFVPALDSFCFLQLLIQFVFHLFPLEVTAKIGIRKICAAHNVCLAHYPQGSFFSTRKANSSTQKEHNLTDFCLIYQSKLPDKFTAIK